MFKKIINFINSKIKSSEYYSSPHALLYRRILESSYDNTFYANLKVPDTIDGRFDVIILHIFVFIKIFKNSSDVEKNFTQKLFDIFMIEVESSYREMGISDQSFGKKMKIVIESFYGRTKLYDQYLIENELTKIHHDCSHVLGFGRLHVKNSNKEILRLKKTRLFLLLEVQVLEKQLVQIF
jgi:hypothetical protein